MAQQYHTVTVRDAWPSHGIPEVESADAMERRAAPIDLHLQPVAAGCSCMGKHTLVHSSHAMQLLDLHIPCTWQLNRLCNCLPCSVSYVARVPPPTSLVASLTAALLHSQVGEEDYNQDGKPELIRFTATAQSRYPVHGLKMLLQFSYVLQVSTSSSRGRGLHTRRAHRL